MEIGTDELHDLRDAISHDYYYEYRFGKNYCLRRVQYKHLIPLFFHQILSRCVASSAL
jgi:hypothetical protein